VLLINHIYHSKLHRIELEEIMSDVEMLKMDDRISKAILAFFSFVSWTMYGITGAKCITSFTVEEDVLVIQFTICNPLNGEVFLLAQLCRNASGGFNSMQKEFAELKYENVSKTVSPLTTSVLRVLPFDSVRTETFRYLSSLSEASGEQDNAQNYLHLNDIKQGYFKACRYFPKIEGSDDFNVTMQILMKPTVEGGCSEQILEEARGAVVS